MRGPQASGRAGIGDGGGEGGGGSGPSYCLHTWLPGADSHDSNLAKKYLDGLFFISLSPVVLHSFFIYRQICRVFMLLALMLNGTLASLPSPPEEDSFPSLSSIRLQRPSPSFFPHGG